MAGDPVRINIKEGTIPVYNANPKAYPHHFIKASEELVRNLEATAIHFGITKCSFYLVGSPRFTVYSDHCPLEKLEQRLYSEVTDSCMRRTMELLNVYDFQV